MLVIVEEVKRNSQAEFSSGLPHMNMLVLTDQQRFIYIRYVRTLGSVKSNERHGKTARDGESRESVRSTQLDDDDDDDGTSLGKV